jgi:FKBP-type peptidyl-prolyl cis-trans isomerase
VPPHSYIMTLRLLFMSAASVCLLGCNQSSDTSTDSKSTATPPATNAATPPPASTPAPPAAAASGQSGDMVTTASGLKYQVLKHGTGTVSPKASDTVKVHYHGTLLDGTVFDSSVERGEPISFPLSRVIPGWTEGVQLMKVGDKFKFVIPPNLAYGPNSPSPKIPPNSTLVFEVELLGIE